MNKLNIEIGQKALITTREWFIAPNGRDYKAVFGTVKAVHSSVDTLGVETNRQSTNWYVEIGNLTMAGCQIHYGVRTDACYLGEQESWTSSAEHGCTKYTRPSFIYNADSEDLK